MADKPPTREALCRTLYADVGFVKLKAERTKRKESRVSLVMCNQEERRKEGKRARMKE